MNTLNSSLKEAAIKLNEARYPIAFTGAGISVESGIPPFRGENGIWNTYDPIVLDLRYFQNNYEKSWQAIKALFYDFLKDKKPNPAHETLAKWENAGLLKTVITQNIDDLHQQAGCTNVIEFHGNANRLICLRCDQIFDANSWVFDAMAPYCPECQGKLKPDFIFFGERIPEEAVIQSYKAIEKCDLIFFIGASGEVSPANRLPRIAAQNGAYVIEVNPEKTLYTQSIVDLVLRGSSAVILPQIESLLNNKEL